MSIIYILIPIAVLLTALGIYLFFWAVKTEQFDDLEKQGMSILFDDGKENDALQVTSEETIKENEECRVANSEEQKNKPHLNTTNDQRNDK